MYKKLLLTSVLLGVLSTNAHADFISKDMFSVNDNLSVLDTDSGLEWLSLTETSGLSLNQVSSRLNTDFSGLRLATENEVLEMIYSFYPQTQGRTSSYMSNQDPSEMQSFINLFGNSGLTSTAYGMHTNSFGMVSMTGVYNGGSYGNINTSNYTSSNMDYSEYYYSSWLVLDDSIEPPAPEEPSGSTPVPIPATGGLLALAMAGLCIRRKSK